MDNNHNEELNMKRERERVRKIEEKKVNNRTRNNSLDDNNLCHVIAKMTANFIYRSLSCFFLNT